MLPRLTGATLFISAHWLQRNPPSLEEGRSIFSGSLAMIYAICRSWIGRKHYKRSFQQWARGSPVPTRV